jgi:hypothetical protein
LRDDNRPTPRRDRLDAIPNRNVAPREMEDPEQQAHSNASNQGVFNGA